jgi:type 1 glutamine amidotransferase
MHANDELYDRLRGPARNVTVLATAYSDRSTGGSGEEEPMLMAIQYGKGRVFHTTLGHDVGAMKCVGFIVTLQRGTEWAATGEVTQKVPDDFPTAKEVRTRK